MGESTGSAPFERFNVDVKLLLIPSVLIVLFVGKILILFLHLNYATVNINTMVPFYRWHEYLFYIESSFFLNFIM